VLSVVRGSGMWERIGGEGRNNDGSWGTGSSPYGHGAEVQEPRRLGYIRSLSQPGSHLIPG